MGDKLSASEALYGFCGWLSARKERVVISHVDDCAVLPPLIKHFCQANELDEPRDGWDDNLKVPPD